MDVVAWATVIGAFATLLAAYFSWRQLRQAKIKVLRKTGRTSATDVISAEGHQPTLSLNSGAMSGTAGGRPLRSFGNHPSRTSVFPEYRLSLESIDSVPCGWTPTITSISYGEGPTRRRIEAARLRFLEPEWRRFGPDRMDSGQWTPRDLLTSGEIERLRTEHRTQPVSGTVVAFPHELTVECRRTYRDSTTAVYIITDVPYLQGIDSGGRIRFDTPCLLGKGGLMSFVTFADGGLDVIDTVGAVGLVSVVEFREARPVRRSQYALVVRCGIRYPEDRWLSGATGTPILTKDTPARSSDARFVFQSRQPNGVSSDLYVADLDGERMGNVSYKEFDAYDGFYAGDEEVVRWIDETHIRYGSYRRGKSEVRIKLDPLHEETLL